MKNITAAEIKQAYKTEKDPRVTKRLLAVHMICFEGKSIEETANTLMHCQNWVSKWIHRFKTGGIDALRDMPRDGRPRMLSVQQIQKVVGKIGKKLTPKKLRFYLNEKYDVLFHITYVRKLLRKLVMSAKTIKRVHIRRPPLEEIYKWQHNAKRRISRLLEKGFVILSYDEAIFIDDPAPGKKYWSKVGEPIVATYKGSHSKVVAFGSITHDGRHLFRTYDKFNKDTVLNYLKKLKNHFGKIVIVMDRAPQHKAKIVTEWLDENKDCVKVLWLPPGTPEIAGIERFWGKSKKHVSVSGTCSRDLAPKSGIMLDVFYKLI